MTTAAELRIAVLPGDGIGVEVMNACLPVLEALSRKLGGPALRWNRLTGGAYRNFYADALGPANNVCVGNDVAIGIDDDARS